MKTKIIEVTESTEFNWGKFMVGRFSEEWARSSEINPQSSRPLLSQVGHNHGDILVLDLQTCEGAVFRPGGVASYDLAKHQIWVCPMYEPFLEWLYRQDLSDIDKLPSVVDLGKVPTSMSGYRRTREGKHGQDTGRV